MEYPPKAHYMMSRMDWFTLLSRIFDKLSSHKILSTETVPTVQFISELTKSSSYPKLQGPAQYFSKPNVRPLSLREVLDSLSSTESTQLAWDQIIDNIIYTGIPNKRNQTAKSTENESRSSSLEQTTVKASSIDGETPNPKEGSKQEVNSLEICYPAQKLVQVPEQIFTGTLQFLSLAGNALIHTSWAFPSSLIVLNLAGNEIKEVLFSTALEKLRLLNLSNNRISQVLSPSKFNRIAELYIGYNSLSSLARLSSLEGLRVLDVPYNELATLEGITGLSVLKGLQTIRIKGNPLLQLPDSSSILAEVLPSHCEVNPVNIIAFSEFSSQFLPFVPLKRPPKQYDGPPMSFHSTPVRSQLLFTPPPIEEYFSPHLKLEHKPESFKAFNTSAPIKVNSPFSPECALSVFTAAESKLPRSSSLRSCQSKSEQGNKPVIITNEQIRDSSSKIYDNPVRAMMISPQPLRHSITPKSQKPQNSASNKRTTKPLLSVTLVKKK